jgi:hypothetical protein
MLLRRGRSFALFAHELDVTIVKPFETRPVSGMDHHRIGQKIAHVLHHSELAELVEQSRTTHADRRMFPSRESNMVVNLIQTLCKNGSTLLKQDPREAVGSGKPDRPAAPRTRQRVLALSLLKVAGGR